MRDEKINDEPYGRVYWITGLAGAGKTTLAKCLYDRMKTANPRIAFLDGDSLREVFGDSLTHSLGDRFKLAMNYARLCKLLSSQGLDVICATVSMFDQCRAWNRAHIPKYCEIYIQVSLDILRKRDQKGLYSQSAAGVMSNVVGIDLPFEEPKNPDLIVQNDGDKTPQEICEDICKNLLLKEVQ